MLGVGLPPGIVSAHFHSALPPQTHPSSMSNVNIAQKKLPTKTHPPLEPPSEWYHYSNAKFFSGSLTA